MSVIKRIVSPYSIATDIASSTISYGVSLFIWAALTYGLAGLISGSVFRCNFFTYVASRVFLFGFGIQLILSSIADAKRQKNVAIGIIATFVTLWVAGGWSYSCGIPLIGFCILPFFAF